MLKCVTMLRRLLVGAFFFGLGAWGAAHWPFSSAVGASQTAKAPTWSSIGGGVGLRTFQTAASTTDIPVAVTALRAHPSRVRIASGALLDAPAWRRKTRALAVVNGGYFDPNNKPLGLRISNNRRTSNLHPADWGVFYVMGNRAYIVHTRDYRALREKGRTRQVLEAIQCGPRLVVAGVPTKLKAQWGRRTGIGIDREGYVVIAVANGQLSFAGWQRLWNSRAGLNCSDALNLDGGGSTQLSLRSGHHIREIGGYWPVPDAITIR